MCSYQIWCWHPNKYVLFNSSPPFSNMNRHIQCFGTTAAGLWGTCTLYILKVNVQSLGERQSSQDVISYILFFLLSRNTLSSNLKIEWESIPLLFSISLFEESQILPKLFLCILDPILLLHPRSNRRPECTTGYMHIHLY